MEIILIAFYALSFLVLTVLVVLSARRGFQFRTLSPRTTLIIFLTIFVEIAIFAAATFFFLKGWQKI